MTAAIQTRLAVGSGRVLLGLFVLGFGLLVPTPMLLAGETDGVDFPAPISARIEKRLDEALARLNQTPAVPLAGATGQGDAVVGNEPAALAVPRAREVEAALERMRGTGADRFTRGFQRFTSYAPEVSAQFRSAGVPPELALLGLIESGFDPRAVSPKQARGIWQFVPETGRRYGLRVEPFRDERTDPEKSTRAAARYLSDLYDLFGDWPLALAAYNAGEDRVLSAMARSGRRDFWSLSRRQLLPAETRDYVPAVLATILYAQERGLGLTSAPTKLRAGPYRIFYAGFRLSQNGEGRY